MRTQSTMARSAHTSKGGMSAAVLQRQCACGQHTQKHVCETCKRNATHLQSSSNDLGGPRTAPPIVHEVLRSTGQPLAQETRTWAEPLFGHNFSHVRVHTDTRAAESARSVNALAYTVGPHMVFGNGHYSPASPGGRKLLTHELTHSVQQAGSGAPSVQTKLEVSRPGDEAEREAETVAQRAVTGRPIRVEARTPSIVHRLSKETWGNISLGLGAASAALGALGVATGHGTAGGIGLGLGAAGIITGLLLRRKKLPPPTSIHVVQNHQIPLDSDAVSRGIRSGVGGVSEIQVSNGDIDYDGSEIQEHFGAGCEDANQSGEGGRGGSTFTVGYGFTSHNPTISFQAKHNTFYDQHLFVNTQNVLPPGTDHAFSVCVQQYSFDGQTIAGKSFRRRFDADRRQIGGQDVAVITLSTTEEGPAQAPAQPAADTAAQPGANAAGQTGTNAPSAAQPNAPPASQPPAAGTPPN